jgi:hypothetical protein
VIVLAVGCCILDCHHCRVLVERKDFHPGHKDCRNRSLGFHLGRRSFGTVFTLAINVAPKQVNDQGRGALHCAWSFGR